MNNKKKFLREDTLDNAIKDAQKVMDDELVVDEPDELVNKLDRALKANRRVLDTGKGQFQSVLLIGHAGVGKTQRVKQWCDDRGLHMFFKDVKVMDLTSLGGIYAPNEDNTQAKSLPTGELNPLDKENTVLFLDEFNRAVGQVRFTLSQLINEHKIPDANQDSGYRFFPNLVLVVAAINPADFGVYNTDELDIAEMDRFRSFWVTPNKKLVRNYLVKLYNNQAQTWLDKGDQEEYKADLGRAALANALLSSKEFEFDDGDDIKAAAEAGQGSHILSPRGLESALQDSDGTKKDFLSIWNDFLNANKKGMAERILNNYQDVDDKANSVFKDNPFKNSGTENWKKIQSALNNL